MAIFGSSYTHGISTSRAGMSYPDQFSRHTGKPLIFQQTIYRERRNFNQKVNETEAAKQHMADSLMKIAVKKYKDVYFVQTNATSPLRESSVDGTHPDDYGYYLWARSIEKPILKILKKYGIR